jgi:outer membrane lipoprotein-sorting protein
VKLHRCLPIAALVLIHPVAAAAQTPAQPPEAVLEKVLTAIGGREALGKLTSRRLTGTVTVSTPAGDISGPIEAMFKPPNKARTYMTLDLTSLGAGQMTMEQKFDGAKAWALNSMQGDTEITGLQLDNMRNNTFPTPLLNYKESGAKLELLANQQIGGRNMILIQVTPKAGSPVKLFIDPDTSLIARTITTIDSPQTGPIEQTSDLSDYRAVDGIKVAFKIVNTNAAQTVTLNFTKVEHNVPIDDAVFVKK